MNKNMIQEFIHPFKGFGRVPSTCLVKMFSDEGETFICFIDLGDGTSVTNASEQIATEIVNEYKLDPTKCRFFETYEQYDYESFDEIEYEWKIDLKEWVAKNPNWHPRLEEIKEIFI
jgi:hypothetical protein